MKLDLEFYNRGAIYLAPALLGKVFVRNHNGRELRARIVEVEAYTGAEDKASHTYGDRRTPRTETMYKHGGHLYVYFIYGMYNMMNVVAADENSGEGVLIRAMEPISPLDAFAQNRFGVDYSSLTKTQIKNLMNGPGKLTKALGVDKSMDGTILTNAEIYIEDDGYDNFEIVNSKRIGIDYAEEAIHFLYRFYIKENKNVSKN